MEKSVNEGKATKVLSSEELQAAAQMKEQIKKVPLMGSKMLAKQIESANTSPEYKSACMAELEKRYPEENDEQAPAPVTPVAPVTPPVDPVTPPVDPVVPPVVPQGEGGQEGQPQ